MSNSMLTPWQERLLRYWSANMMVLEDMGATYWPGFGYTDAEKAIMRGAAARVSTGALGTFYLVTTIAFLVIAAVIVVVAFMGLLLKLYPDPSQTPALSFVLVLAGACALSLGLGVPASMAVAAWVADSAHGANAGSSGEPEAALYRLIRFQLRRMALIMAGVFVPGCLTWIAFNIQAGPAIAVLKFVTLAVTLASMAGAVMMRGR